MASSRVGLHGSDLLDVTSLLEAFEDLNGCRIVITLELKRTGVHSDIQIGAVAEQTDQEKPVASILASVSATCSAINQKTLEACVIRALYSLDGQIARNELESEATKKA